MNTDKIGNTDFHSDDSSILRRGFAEAEEKLHENYLERNKTKQNGDVELRTGAGAEGGVKREV